MKLVRWYSSRLARLARIVVPGLPHHVTPRGNRREAIFFEDGDQEIYRDLLAEQTLKEGVEVWTERPGPLSTLNSRFRCSATIFDEGQVEDVQFDGERQANPATLSSG